MPFRYIFRSKYSYIYRYYLYDGPGSGARRRSESIIAHCTESMASVARSTSVHTFIKANAASRIGIRLAEAKGGSTVNVADIDPSGPLGASKLKKGELLVSVNGEPCTSFDVAMSLLKNASGEVVLETSPSFGLFRRPSSNKQASTPTSAVPEQVTLTFTKSTADAKIGVRIAESQQIDTILVEDVNPNGPLGAMNLSKGDVLLSVNGEACTSYDSTMHLLKTAVGEVVLEVRSTTARMPSASRPGSRPSPRPGNLVNITIMKPKADTKVGVRVAETRSGDGVLVAEVDPTGPAASIVKKGDYIISINGEPCTSHAQTSALLKAASGEVVLAVRQAPGSVPSKAQGALTINLQKAQASSKVGVRFGESKRGDVRGPALNASASFAQSPASR